MVDNSDGNCKPPNRFPTTRWSLFKVARSSDPQEKHAALQYIIDNYYNPIYAFIRRHAQSVEEAEDLTHDFLTNCLSKDLFSHANPTKGRFRNFLQKSIKNFLFNKHRYNLAQCRHPEAGFTNFSESIDEKSYDGDNPEKVFIRAFVSTIVLKTLSELEKECKASNQSKLFYIFQRRIVEPILDGAQPISVKQLAANLGLTDQKVFTYLRKAKKAYINLLRQETSKYAINEDDIENEVADILTFLNLN